jgi:hypothetical protein
VSLLNKCGFLVVLAILDLGVIVLLVAAWRDMVVVASCKRQHENWIVAWELLYSSLAFVVLSSLLLTIQQKNDCPVVNIVIMAL